MIGNNLLRRGVSTGLNRAARRVRRAGGWLPDRRGAMAAVMAVSIPAMIALGGWALDQSYVYYRYQLLKHAAEAAAMAGHTELAS